MKQLIIIFLISITACASFEPKMNANNGSILNKIKSNRDIILKNEVIEDSINLIALLNQHPINELAGFVTVYSNIYFQNCTFNKDVIASIRSGGEVATQFKGSVSFINCKFTKEVDFRSSVFHGPVDFSESVFQAGSNFQDAIFMQRATFNGCFWKGEGKFQQTRFYHAASFMDSWSKENMMFQEANFRDNANFSITNFTALPRLS